MLTSETPGARLGLHTQGTPIFVDQTNKTSIFVLLDIVGEGGGRRNGSVNTIWMNILFKNIYLF